jgi:hypothetical protein
MDIYDNVTADTLEVGDQIFHENDYVEVNHVVKDNGAVLVRGYSHVSGDTVTYIIGYDVEVGLWAI